MYDLNAKYVNSNFFKGRSGFKQYTPMKPIKRGGKL